MADENVVVDGVDNDTDENVVSETSKPASSDDGYIGKAYKVVISKDFGDTARKLDGAEVYVSTTDDWAPKSDERFGWFTRSRMKPGEADYVETASAKHALSKKGINKFFKADQGWVPLSEEGATITGYARLIAWRKSALALIGVLVAIALVIVIGLLNGVPPQNIPIIAADAIGITNNNSDTHATIEGTTSFQSPYYDQMNWKAGATAQHFVMANPSYNTVALAPHIYIDVNGDGKFADDECIYNPKTIDKDGKITSYGLFIEPGKQLEDIELTQTVEAGTYNARLEYTAVDIETKTLCNGQNFDFELTFE